MNNEIASDDDSGVFKDARITIDIQKNSDYVVRLTTANPEEKGAFKLIIEKHV